MNSLKIYSQELQSKLYLQSKLVLEVFNGFKIKSCSVTKIIPMLSPFKCVIHSNLSESKYSKSSSQLSSMASRIKKTREV